MTIMLKRFICKSAGRFKYLLCASILIFGTSSLNTVAWAQRPQIRSTLKVQKPESKKPNEVDLLGDSEEWLSFEQKVLNEQRSDYQLGLSYIISGSIALAGGFIGQQATRDPLERGIYTIFQSIGIGSIGYGAYRWQLGDDDRLIYSSLKKATLTNEQRGAMVFSFYNEKKERESRERVIRAITHALIASLNIYNATQESNESIKNAMYFVGGVNLLATISFTF